jgi:4-diphosphocytidyl-2-C-methyl-D-erythritol kinase
MLIRNEESIIEIWCPAKLNLYLEVKGKRPDGYHEIETVMQTVSIYDRLVIRRAPSGEQLTCSDPAILCGAENTVMRAAAEMRAATGARDGVKIHLEKNIPPGAGLAGGSSDAAGMIAGLNILWQAGLSEERLAEIGAAIGSDVPFFFASGTALCKGRGEIVARLPAGRPLSFVVLWPGFEISTRDVYSLLSLRLTDQAVNGRIFALVQQLARAEPEPGTVAGAIAPLLFNRLEEPAIAAYAKLQNVKRLMAGEGILGPTMTGSGSAFFGLCERKEAAQKITDSLATSGHGSVFACESVQC